MGLCKNKGSSSCMVELSISQRVPMCDFISSEGMRGVPNPELCLELQLPGVDLVGTLREEPMSRKIGVKRVSSQTLEVKC